MSKKSNVNFVGYGLIRILENIGIMFKKSLLPSSVSIGVQQTKFKISNYTNFKQKFIRIGCAQLHPRSIISGQMIDNKLENKNNINSRIKNAVYLFWYSFSSYMRLSKPIYFLGRIRWHRVELSERLSDKIRDFSSSIDKILFAIFRTELNCYWQENTILYIDFINADMNAIEFYFC